MVSWSHPSDAKQDYPLSYTYYYATAASTFEVPVLVGSFMPSTTAYLPEVSISG
jgi:hypothetical protein